jgi:hypothetical protein
LIPSGSGGGDAPDPPKFTAKTQGNYGTRSPQTSATGGGGSHTHGFTNPTWSGSFTGAAMNFAVQYVDVIFASKD